jgi:hypothetical protein
MIHFHDRSIFVGIPNDACFPFAAFPPVCVDGKHPLRLNGTSILRFLDHALHPAIRAGGRFPGETLKQVPAPAILPFRHFLFAIVLLLSPVLPPGEAGAEWGLEITPYPDSTEIFCVSSGGAACDVKVNGDVLGQILLMAGITFSL